MIGCSAVQLRQSKSGSKRACFTYFNAAAERITKRQFYGRLRRRIGPILRELCRQRGIELLEGHTMPDHIQMCLGIPPKHSVAFVLGFLKGKSAVRIHRELLHERRMSGLSFWAPGYCVSTVGLDEARVRQYIREQEELENRQGELDLE